MMPMKEMIVMMLTNEKGDVHDGAAVDDFTDDDG